MKRTSRLLLALPLVLGMMGTLGCDSTESNAELSAQDADTDTPQWVNSTEVSKAEITVTGMAWGTCEATVSGAIAGIEGVEDVLIDRSTNQVMAKLADGAELTEAQVKEALADHQEFQMTEFALQPAAPSEDAGSSTGDDEVEGETWAVVMQVPGMAWGGCAAAVRREVGSLEGVLSVTPDLTTREVEVVVAQGTEITQEQLAAAVTEAGFELTEAEFSE